MTRTFTAQISAAGGSDVTTLASLTNVSPEDPVVANNNKSITTHVSAGSDLTLSKLRSPGGNIFIGDTVIFTLSPSFTGSTPNDITVSDSIPANYTIVSAGPAAGSAFSCNVTGQDVTCTLTAGGAAGVNVPLGDIEIVTTVASVGTPTNSAAITALGPLDPDPANNVANDGGATILEPSIDLSAIKDGSPLLSDGGTAVYRIGVMNVGTIGFFGTARMVDSIPAGLTVTSINMQGWTCPVTLPLVGPAPITCELVYTSASPLVPGARTNLVALRGDVSGVGALSNSLTVSTPDGNTADTNAANDTITFGSVVGSAASSAELGVIKRANLPTLPVGDEQTFEIEVTNSGPQPSLDVTLTDNIRDLLNDAVGATNAGFISAVFDPLSAGSCSTGPSGATSRRLTCILPSVAVCTTGVDCPVLTVKVVPGGNAGSRSNSVNVTSATTPDPTQASNNQFSVPYAVTARADVTLSKVGSPDPATAGQEITYVLTATNLANALSAAENVTVTDTLPDNLTFVSATPSSGTCGTIPAVGGVTGSTTTNDVICNLGTVNNGAQRTVTILARANTLTSQGVASITNVASVSTTTDETDTTNNTATLTTAIQPPSLDLLVNKTDSVDPIEVGEDTVYTISVTNVGPSAAEDVVLTDTMPPLRLSFQSFTVDAGGLVARCRLSVLRVGR